jgi:hypothetical protein
VGDVKNSLGFSRLDAREDVSHGQGVARGIHVRERLLDHGIGARSHLRDDPVARAPMALRSWNARSEVELCANVLHCARTAERGFRSEGFGGFARRKQGEDNEEGGRKREKLHQRTRAPREPFH